MELWWGRVQQVLRLYCLRSFYTWINIAPPDSPIFFVASLSLSLSLSPPFPPLLPMTQLHTRGIMHWPFFFDVVTTSSKTWPWFVTSCLGGHGRRVCFLSLCDNVLYDVTVVRDLVSCRARAAWPLFVTSGCTMFQSAQATLTGRDIGQGAFWILPPLGEKLYRLLVVRLQSKGRRSVFKNSAKNSEKCWLYLDIFSCVKIQRFLLSDSRCLSDVITSTKLEQTGEVFWDSQCCLSATVSAFWTRCMKVKWGVTLFLCWL